MWFNYGRRGLTTVVKIRRFFCTSEEDLKMAGKAIQMTDLHKSVFKRLKGFHNEYEAISKILNNPEESQTAEAAQARLKINSVAEKNNQFEMFREWLQEAKDCADIVGDPSLEELVAEEKLNLTNRLDEITSQSLEILLEKDKYDDCNITIVEFRPGVGGGEAMIFAEEMLNTFKSYCSSQGWRVEVIHYNADTSVGKGIKNATLRVTGQDSYIKLKCESGVHK